MVTHQFFDWNTLIVKLKTIGLYLGEREPIFLLHFYGGIVMSISYDKLWALVRRNKMKKYELARAAQLTQESMRKLNHDEPVHMKIMIRFCKIFHCEIGDLMDVIED